MRNTLCRLVLAAVLSLVASTATAASSIVVTLDPTDVQAGAPPRIEITNVTMGGRRVIKPGQIALSARESAPPVFEDVVLVKHVDASSPALFRYFVSRRLKTVLIEFLQPIQGQVKPYFAIRLSDVNMMEYALGGSVPASGSPGASDTETVRLIYSRIETFYPESKQQTSYDLRTGIAQ